jgi:uncharacterized protein YndB with AHSA1/START domain
MPVTGRQSATVTLPADDQILITRVFAAPARHVWAAFTTPEHVRRWWHAGRGEVTLCEIDFRVGGSWRYVIETDRGFEVGFHGVYREIVPHGRVITTEVYEGFPDGEAVNTVTLVERDGQTTMAVLVQHTCKEHRDGHIASGMEAGMQDAYDLLEEVAAGLR